ncbi:hypothetical protein E2C01_005545 [Portunus trituberculatus]|uniref:Uncharacterized protein n=1 Tax=Portunus trituberculatus TaxID=210409 RepID=A0A5B7CT03_PORTR|nr:hypothetical protein [Portunus trituberculatus]
MNLPPHIPTNLPNPPVYVRAKAHEATITHIRSYAAVPGKPACLLVRSQTPARLCRGSNIGKPIIIADIRVPISVPGSLSRGLGSSLGMDKGIFCSLGSERS